MNQPLENPRYSVAVADQERPAITVPPLQAGPLQAGQPKNLRVACGLLLSLAMVAGIVLAVRHIILVDLGWAGLQQRANPSGAVAGHEETKGPQKHPLESVLDFARQVQHNIQTNVHDYTATVIKQERFGDKLGPQEICSVKIRNQPFSAYMLFLAPEDHKGQEALYVEGQNEGKLVGHAGSGLTARLGSIWLPPNGPLAMMGQRYPITELGIANLTRRLIEVGEHDLKFDECYVWRDENAKVGNRPCTAITVMHPERRPAFLFHIARIFIDKQLMVPLHYEAYDWAKNPGEEPLLLERYTYANLKLNPGLTDADFDPKNPEYNFGIK